MKINLTIYIMLLTVNHVWSQSHRQKEAVSLINLVSTEIKVPLTEENWFFQEGKVQFIEYKGVKAIKLDENSGYMIYKDLNFENGTIEFDVEVDRPSPFPTIYFRWMDDKDAEHVYLRTGTHAKKNAFDAVQYASIINGVNIWDLQHEYQTAADIKINEWNHIKLVISGKQLKVYVNDLSEPCLQIPSLEGNTTHGRIGLGTGFPGQSVFANLIVKPDQLEGLSAIPGADITAHDTRYIRDWQVTDPIILPLGNEVISNNLPKPETKFTSISAGRRGLVNLSRKFGGDTNRRFVWLKATITSDIIQSQILKLGFSDEIWVYLNKQPIFVDKDLYIEGMRKSPNGRISLDNSQFPLPLKQGENELLIAVANNFYGWGIMARLEHLEGLEIEK
jgi:hypothetical protein